MCGRQWYEWMPRRWRGEQEIARRYMPGATSSINADGEAAISGWYPLLDRHGHVRDTFGLSIVYPIEFLPLYPTIGNPWCFSPHPNVYLDSHRDIWVKGADAHIFPSWRLCLYVPAESGIDVKRPDCLERIFESVATFLTKQRFFQRDLRLEAKGGPKAKWPGPDRAHAVAGYWEAIQAIGGLADGDPCVCGQRRRYGDCCRRAIEAYAVEQEDAGSRMAG